MLQWLIPNRKVAPIIPAAAFLVERSPQTGVVFPPAGDMAVEQSREGRWHPCAQMHTVGDVIKDTPHVPVSNTAAASANSRSP